MASLPVDYLEAVKAKYDLKFSRENFMEAIAVMVKSFKTMQSQNL